MNNGAMNGLNELLGKHYGKEYKNYKKKKKKKKK